MLSLVLHGGMDSLRIFRLWAAAAWADGVLHVTEEAALRRFLEATTDLRADERKQAFAYLEGPLTLDPAEVAALNRDAREGVYRAVLGIVRLDRVVTSEELAWLERLRAHLDLDATTIARIESEHRR